MTHPRLTKRWSLARAARLFVLALVIGVGISQIILSVANWHLSDADAYWNAAVRLRDGAPLYPQLGDSEASDVYRYAPWFAWAWVPLTFLPHGIVNVLWSGVLLGASAAALVPLVRMGAWTLVALFAPILFGISAIGNVQPLIVAALVLGVDRRSGPLWIAATASLKAVPIILVLTYIGRRQWDRAALAVGLTGLLVAPMLLYDLSHYPASAGVAGLIPGGPIPYVTALLAGTIISVVKARSPFGWLSSATTAAVAIPRFFVYDLTFLMVALPAGRFVEALGSGRADLASRHRPDTASKPAES
ncbi:MAG: hypothetical protein ACR2I5_03770 [Candidatus Limnocylindria bacterium]